MKIRGEKITKKNLIYAIIFFLIAFYLIFLALTSAHVGEEETSELNVGLTTSTPTPQPNQEITMDFYITDKSGPLISEQLQETHTKKLHLIGMRKDLSNYFHLHPEPTEVNGHYVVTYSFPEDGVYKFWLEFKHDDEENVETFEVTVGGGTSYPLAIDFTDTKVVEGYRVEIDMSSEPLTGKDIQISFDISDALTGEPVNLGMYLGAFAHVIVVNSELTHFIHGHSEIGEEAHEITGHFIFPTGRHVEDKVNGETESGPEVGHISTVINFPEKGIYKIFLEFNPLQPPDEKVVQTGFLVNAEKSRVNLFFFVIFPILLIITILGTVIIANYGKTGRLSIPLLQSKLKTAEKSTEMDEGGKKFKKTLLIIGFVLFSIFVIGMIWLASGYDPKGRSTDVMFWYILAYTAGLSMIFLPCTLPLAFVIVPLSMGEKPKKGFIMALLFGLGLTLTITSYGLAMASLGKILGFDRATQIMWLVAGFVAFFFGLGELKLLPFRIPGYSGALPGFFQRHGDYFKAFLMGLFLGNAGAGCPNPAFYVLLTYITTVGSIGTGTLLGLVHGIGRAIPLIFLSIAGIVGINATQAIVRHKEKVEKGIGFALIVVGAYILMLGIYGKAWWENSIVHKVWSEFLSLINPEFGEAAAGAGTAPLTPFYVLTVVTALVVAWYYLDKKYFGQAVAVTEEISAAPKEKAIEEKIFDEVKKLEEIETKIEQLEEKQMKELEEIKSTLKKTRGKEK